MTNAGIVTSLLTRNRMLATRFAGLIVLGYVTLSAPPFYIYGWVAVVLELIGYILLVLSATGRIWCLVFISGRKNQTIVDTGPYSIVRNPLYVFNLIAVLGFGLAVGRPILAVLLTIGFIVFYREAVAKEEEHLIATFGEMFTKYAASTPRWLPRFENYHEPDRVLVDPFIFRRGIIDAGLILALFFAWKIIEHLRMSLLLPTFI